MNTGKKKMKKNIMMIGKRLTKMKKILRNIFIQDPSRLYMLHQKLVATTLVRVAVAKNIKNAAGKVSRKPANRKFALNSSVWFFKYKSYRVDTSFLVISRIAPSRGFRNLTVN